MKVFISSVITGYEDYRSAAQAAVESLGHEVIRAEALGASTSSPRVACLRGVRDADLVVLLMGSRYGAPQASGLSATHEEFREARDAKEIIALVESVTWREPSQEQFLVEVQDWQGGLFTESFSDPEGLRRTVTRLLHQRLVGEAQGATDNTELLERAISLLPQEKNRSVGRTSLGLSIAGGPHQNLLRPAEIESDEVDSRLFQLALHGTNSIFSRSEGTEKEVINNALLLRQPSRSLAVYADGSMVLRLPIESQSQMMAIIEDDVRALLGRALGFLNEALHSIDGSERLRHVCPAAIILGADYGGWRTREEDRRSPNSMTMGLGGEKPAIHLTPPSRPRAALRTKRTEIAEDLIVLMRRQFIR